MHPDHWFLALLSVATLLYVAWSMARIVTVQREIAQMLREMRDR